MLDSISEVKRELSKWIYEQVKGTVISGPFKGMKMVPDTGWVSSYLPPLLLGCYEEELHGVLEQQITRLETKDAPVIVVVGCAEGYYAIGLKRRLPNAQVYAVDTDEMALTIARTNASLNGVHVNFGRPAADGFACDPALVLMDCEGAEVDYLDLEKHPALASAHIILEVHNLPDQETDKILLERMRGTHRINMIFEGPRHPAKYPLLCHLPSEGRWLAVSEGRPCLMAWFDMTPRGLLAS